jgi:hypothetical protein
MFYNFLIHLYLYIFYQCFFWYSYLFDGYMINFMCLLFHNLLDILNVRIQI